MLQKRMFKVIAPMDKKDGSGTKWWLRCGSGFLNRDNSINLYIDALPVAANKDNTTLTLQVREVTEDDMREREERRASYSSRGPLHRPLGGSFAGSLDANGSSFAVPHSSPPLEPTAMPQPLTAGEVPF